MIPVLDLKAQYAGIAPQIDAAIQEVLNGAEFVLGPPVRNLEMRIADYVGCRHALGVASGSDALRLAMAALDVGPGDEVITTPFTFIATANTISHSGATPVFVDIDPKTYNIDPALIEAAITPRTRAIVPVHLYGQPADMTAIMAIAAKHNLPVVEDCAQAIGARYKGQRVGCFGDIGCFSFYPTKNLGAYGDGGMVITNDASLAEKLDILRRQGSKTRYEATLLGFNSRLDSLQAAILGVKLNYLDQWNDARRAIAARYDELLADLPVVLPYTSPDVFHVYHQYTVRTKQRNELADYLKQQGIGSMVYYPVPIHRQEVYTALGYAAGSRPVSEEVAAEVLSLPIYPELSDDQLQTIAAAFKEFFRKSGS